MDNKFYYDKLLEELLLNYKESSIENIIKNNVKNGINNCNKINSVTFDLIKGTENLEKLNGGGLNENYDYLENDCNLKEKSELFLKELGITEEELNEEAINYHNIFTNIEKKKEKLNDEYLSKVNNLKEELNRSINSLNDEFNINQNSFKNINNIFKIISLSQDNINKYNCEVNTIEKFINTIQKNINFDKDNENKKNKKNNDIFTKDMELSELQNINESIFINLENKIKNNFSNNLRFIMFNKIIIYLENQKKIVNENIIKEQININKITYFLMKNKWFEKAKIVDTKINYIIESIKKNYNTYTQNIVDDNLNCLYNNEDNINILNNCNENTLKDKCNQKILNNYFKENFLNNNYDENFLNNNYDENFLNNNYDENFLNNNYDENFLNKNYDENFLNNKKKFNT